MKVNALLRYALSDLRHRSITTVFNVGAVALAATYVFVLGFYGASIHGYQEQVLEQSMPTKVIASVRDVTDNSMRFTDERIAALGELEHADLVFPHIELNVRLGLTPERTIDLPAEGTVPGDPTLPADRLIWGSGIESVEAHEVVVSRALFAKLGGSFVADVPSQTTLILEVGRTVDGRDEHQRLQLDLAGIVDYQSSDHAYVPLELLRNLNLWCRNRIQDLDRKSAALRRSYDVGFAYSPASAAERVEGEAQLLQIDVSTDGRFEVTDGPRPFWAVLERTDGAALGPADQQLADALLGEAQRWPVHLREYEGAQVAALSPDDPRWALTTKAEGDDSLYLVHRGESGRQIAPDAIDAGKRFPVDADVAAEPEAFRHLFFDPDLSDGVHDYCLVESRTVSAARVLADWPGAAPVVGQDRGWLFLRFGLLSRAAARAPLAAGYQALEARARRRAFTTAELTSEPWALGRTRLMVAPTTPEIEAACRVLPGSFFHALVELSGRSPSWMYAGSRRRAGIAVSAVSGFKPSLVELAGAKYSVACSLQRPLEQDEVWVAHPPTGYDSQAAGLVSWGAVMELYHLLEAGEAAGWEVDFAASRLTDKIMVVVPGTVQATAARLGEVLTAQCEIKPFQGVLAGIGEGHRGVIASDRELGEVTPGCLHVRQSFVPTGNIVLEGDRSWSSPPVRVQPFGDLPPGLGVVAHALFLELAWSVDTRTASLGTNVREDVAFENTLTMRVSERLLADKGLILRPLSTLRTRELVRYRITDQSRDDGRVGADLLSVIGMSQPTFIAARPALSLEAELEGSQDTLKLSSSDGRDPERFSQLPLSGRWLRNDENASQVLLPQSLIQPGRDPRGLDAVGSVLSLRFRRKTTSRKDDTLLIPLRVVGVIEGEEAFVPLALMTDLELWQSGKVVFNETRGTFESPLEISERNGAVRCNVFAVDQAAVEPLVASLRNAGYLTEDKLAEQAGLQRLGRVLAGIVIVFVLGALVNAAITVFVATLMNVKSKIYEIGILRAHGLSRGEVVSIFAAQGLAVGVLAFLTAAAATWLLEPYLREVVAQVFDMKEGGVISGSPFDDARWWLPPLAFGVAVAFSLGGVILPAFYASSLSPVEALRRRE